jgi:outer membrane murein-binding lipoprotein Lpp
VPIDGFGVDTGSAAIYSAQKFPQKIPCKCCFRFERATANGRAAGSTAKPSAMDYRRLCLFPYDAGLGQVVELECKQTPRSDIGSRVVALVGIISCRPRPAIGRATGRLFFDVLVFLKLRRKMFGKSDLLDSLSRDLARTRDKRDALASEVTTLTAEIAVLEARLSAEKDRRERERAASEIERIKKRLNDQFLAFAPVVAGMRGATEMVAEIVPAARGLDCHR